jgi:tetratricopeptide (TPR) repeat protein
LSASAERLP